MENISKDSYFKLYLNIEFSKVLTKLFLKVCDEDLKKKKSNSEVLCKM